MPSGAMCCQGAGKPTQQGLAPARRWTFTPGTEGQQVLFMDYSWHREAVVWILDAEEVEEEEKVKEEEKEEEVKKEEEEKEEEEKEERGEGGERRKNSLQPPPPPLQRRAAPARQRR
ncbi:hypothetical protein DUI87_07260 [Hirundo rustica rustica]|uniref:Uncharacterized protein n=1 Tax=Hirundo rustica rustica TaxID=333673 RepID=A0A3M0KWD2_HIRRU|nr:hypothetical protein DUI87_07260 [Hirundo rustica rustica]